MIDRNRNCFIEKSLENFNTIFTSGETVSVIYLFLLCYMKQRKIGYEIAQNLM